VPHLGQQSELLIKDPNRRSRIATNALLLAGALTHDTDIGHTKRSAIKTDRGLASVSVSRFEHPLDTPRMLGALLETPSTLVIETHNLDEGDFFSEYPDVFCGAAKLAIEGTVQAPIISSIEVSPYFNDEWLLEKQLEEVYQGTTGYGYQPPADPRTDPDALAVVRAFADSRHSFEHPALIEVQLQFL
jgi:hypothetical protein